MSYAIADHLPGRGLGITVQLLCRERSTMNLSYRIEPGPARAAKKKRLRFGVDVLGIMISIG